MDERIKYKCNGCGFRFTRKKEVSFKHCPYCGKIGTWNVDSGNFSSKVLEEVASLNF